MLDVNVFIAGLHETVKLFFKNTFSLCIIKYI